MAAAVEAIERKPIPFLPNENPVEWIRCYFLQYFDKFLTSLTDAYPLENFPESQKIHEAATRFRRATRTVEEDDIKKEEKRRTIYGTEIVEEFVRIVTTNSALFSAALSHDVSRIISCLPSSVVATYGLRAMFPSLRPNASVIFMYTDVLCAASINFALLRYFPQSILKKMARVMKLAGGTPSAALTPEQSRAMGVVKGMIPAEANEVLASCGPQIMEIAMELASTVSTDMKMLTTMMNLIPNVSTYGDWLKTNGENEFVTEMRQMWAAIMEDKADEGKTK